MSAVEDFLKTNDGNVRVAYVSLPGGTCEACKVLHDTVVAAVKDRPNTLLPVTNSDDLKGVFGHADLQLLFVAANGKYFCMRGMPDISALIKGIDRLFDPTLHPEAATWTNETSLPV